MKSFVAEKPNYSFYLTKNLYRSSQTVRINVYSGRQGKVFEFLVVRPLPIILYAIMGTHNLTLSFWMAVLLWGKARCHILVLYFSCKTCEEC